MNFGNFSRAKNLKFTSEYIVTQIQDHSTQHTCQAHERSVNCAAVNSQGTLFLTGSDDLKAIVWSLDTSAPKVIL